jgi:hypothetical protein
MMYPRPYVGWIIGTEHATALGQWFSTCGTPRHLRGYGKTSCGVCKIGKENYFVIIMARFRVIHRRPGRKDIGLTGQNHINN